MTYIPPAGIGHNNPPTVNVAMASIKAFVANLPADTRPTLARLVYDLAVASVCAVNVAIQQLMPNIPLVRGIVVKAAQGAVDGTINSLAGLLEEKLES